VIRSLPDEGVDYLVGGPSLSARPRPPFDSLACEFTGALSKLLRGRAATNAYTDLATFAFWCREANVKRLKQAYDDGQVRLGRGLAFHIAPSNVPVNFAFSLVMGLLAGNANVVRVPSALAPQAVTLIDAIRDVLSEDRFDELAKETAIVSYPRGRAITAGFSALADARVIWGGDATVNEIRALPAASRCMDLCFGDRYSLCVLNAESVLNLPDEEMNRLVRNFFNDTYVLDQNACSSPQIVIWTGDNPDAAGERFWPAVRQYVGRTYELEAGQAVDKLVATMSSIISVNEVTRIVSDGIDVVRLNLNALPAELETARGRYGMFFEYTAGTLEDIVDAIRPKFQTMTYFGFTKDELASFVLDKRLVGFDRLVPVGRALEMDLVWDGNDIVRHLSRVISIL